MVRFCKPVELLEQSAVLSLQHMSPREVTMKSAGLFYGLILEKNDLKELLLKQPELSMFVLHIVVWWSLSVLRGTVQFGKLWFLCHTS